ncbi:MAG: gliding motility-associated ABC transporter permease subunit GldF [Cytophagales bacterium]|nr:gliding motility-associated ABC transporter permease subunit GldF [Cytophagales bacterium]
MLNIFIKETNIFLNSLIAYIVIGLFLCGTGLLFWVFPQSSVLEYGFASLDSFFSLTPYVFLFLIPAITMRMIAEEKKEGTLPLLLSKPLSNTSIVMGKFFASWFLVLIALLPTLLYVFSLYELGNPAGNLDLAGTCGSYIGLLLLAAVFCSVGIFCSSVTENQITAFVFAVFVCFVLFLAPQSLSQLSSWSKNALILEKWGIVYHYNSLSKGLLDSRSILYFISLSGFILYLSTLKLASRKW